MASRFEVRSCRDHRPTAHVARIEQKNDSVKKIEKSRIVRASLFAVARIGLGEAWDCLWTGFDIAANLFKTSS